MTCALLEQRAERRQVGASLRLAGVQFTVKSAGLGNGAVAITPTTARTSSALPQSLSILPTSATLRELERYLSPGSGCAADVCSFASSDYWDLSETASTASQLDDEDLLQSVCSVSSSCSDFCPESKYRLPKIKSWFRDAIDKQSVGQVNFREFLAALRKHDALQCALCEAAGICFDEADRRLHERLQKTGVLGLGVEARTEALLREKRRIRDVYEKICGSADRTFDLTVFIAFFRARGLLLQ